MRRRGEGEDERGLVKERRAKEGREQRKGKRERRARDASDGEEEGGMKTEWFKRGKRRSDLREWRRGRGKGRMRKKDERMEI